ncbi:MAG TPA: radical SAM family heme chaperone HemW [Candidatus Scatocola faecipullorum]|uniref:Heme chaperone HemW n=1 Tax=Candidatus Scatocola faecipullorum TaxID=2840917 RepID=A0A9D1M3J7_9PROT|nr:radical SAM family heme chaperone HemW [Candidatus Scatocola faecipullorum]
MEKQLITYSRQLRSNQTNAEKLLWQKLRKRQLGVRFQRQYVFDNKYIVDFYCASLKLIIEINGGQHNDNHQDDIRDNYIKKRGCKILRFWNNDILENIEGCLSQITNLIPTVPPLNIKGRLEENYASRELHEDASTGRHPQKTNAFFNNDFSEAYAGGSTERRTAAYTDVREDASTGRRLQKTNKIIVPLSVYIHWPYCLSKCPYCDFFSKVDKHVDQKQIIDGYLDDLNWYHDLTAKQTVQSIFFGGGTPSLIEPQYIEKVINHIFKLWPTTKQVEISLEANPNTNRPNLFADLRLAGINRLSLGIQALNDKDLKFLGRTHNLSRALHAVDEVTRLFDNHSADLIYARPGQTAEAWKQELNQISELGLKHLSLYQLTIEEGTFFARKGIKPMDDEPAAELYALTQEFLATKGYPQYEVSNFAHPGYESIHNLAYWRGQNYLGIGPAAHGRIKTTDKIYASTHHRQLEELTPQERAEELIIMGLRIREGINKENFRRQCGLELTGFVNDKARQSLIRQKLLFEDKHSLRAANRGFLLLNKIIEELCR